MGSLHARAATVDLGRPGRNGAHTRQASDIDSLSPEVLAALQSTFGGKLSELRSQASLQKEKQEPTSPEPAPPRQQAEEGKEVADSENEGLYLVIGYAAGIVASIAILLIAGGSKPNEDVSCKGLGDSRCVRLYGYILPLALTGISLLLALIVSVFDVSFGVYNILKTTENFFWADTFRLSDIPPVALSYIIDVGFVGVAVSLLWLAKASAVDPLFTLCEEGKKVFWTFGLITMGTVIFWCAAKSFSNPMSTHLFMRRAAKIVILLLLLCGAISLLYNLVSPPRPSGPCQAPEAAEVNGTEDSQLQLYYKGWLYELPDPPESKQVQLFSELHQLDWCPWDSQQCLVLEELPQCRPRAMAKDDDSGMCPARDDGGSCEARNDLGVCEVREDQGMCEARDELGMCEARDDRGTCEPRYDQGVCMPRSDEGVCLPRWRNEMCEAMEWEESQWPWLKRLDVYERTDKCKYDLRVCDWPLAKRVQIYESQTLCKYDCPSCDWPLVKRIQVYARGDRCGPLTLPNCDWPYLKQIRRYEAKGRCSWDERPECDWPFVKQIQAYERRSWCPGTHYQGCDGAQRVEGDSARG